MTKHADLLNMYNSAVKGRKIARAKARKSDAEGYIAYAVERMKRCRRPEIERRRRIT